MQLQQRLQELKERERRAQQHNRQLLLQFERAQETLKEMLACNAAMKTIRVTGCTQPTHTHTITRTDRFSNRFYLALINASSSVVGDRYSDSIGIKSN